MTYACSVQAGYCKEHGLRVSCRHSDGRGLCNLWISREAGSISVVDVYRPFPWQPWRVDHPVNGECLVQLQRLDRDRSGVGHVDPGPELSRVGAANYAPGKNHVHRRVTATV